MSSPLLIFKCLNQLQDFLGFLTIFFLFLPATKSLIWFSLWFSHYGFWFLVARANKPNICIVQMQQDDILQSHTSTSCIQSNCTSKLFPESLNKCGERIYTLGLLTTSTIMNNYTGQLPAPMTTSLGVNTGWDQRGWVAETALGVNWYWNIFAAITSSLMTRQTNMNTRIHRYSYMHAHSPHTICCRHVGAGDHEGEWGNDEKLMADRERQEERTGAPPLMSYWHFQSMS